MNSIFELFKVSIGPSSSHTVGPMSAATRFCNNLHDDNILHRVEKIQIELFGSLAYTGKAHGTDKALILGLMGYTPITINIIDVSDIVSNVQTSNSINIISRRLFRRISTNTSNFHGSLSMLI